MKKLLILFIVSTAMLLNAQTNTCYSPYSLCASFSYAAQTNSGSAGAGPDYNCLASQPNPTWFYTTITNPGTVQYQISHLQGADIDFMCWGPFSSMNNICSQLDSAHYVDCSFSASATETLTINGGLVGQYYMILVTNYSNQTGVINFQTIPNTGIACAHLEGISGIVFHDTNANCSLDGPDTFLNNIPVKQYDALGNFIALSYPTSYGNYHFPYRFYSSLGTYLLSIDTTNLPYTPQCIYPGIDSVVTLTTANPCDTAVHFSLQCKPGFDIGVQSVIRSGWVFPGQPHVLRVMAGDVLQSYNLNCTANISGQVVINLSGPVGYLSPAAGALTPSSVVGNTLIYNIPDFSVVNFYNSFVLNLYTDTTAIVGDSICVDVTVTPTLGDNNTSNNSLHFCYNVFNSYDPNMKETYPKNVMPGYNDWFYYTIHFQNTGSAPAFNIGLTDTLSNYLDLSTFERINYSHNNTTSLVANVLQFNFNNINLPDSNSNNLGSKGYVQYRVKPKTNLPAGTVINNTAYIYFDYNAPIVTNTSHNTYMMVTSIKENVNNGFAVYPNPTTGMVTISPNATSALMNVLVYNIIGDVVFENKTIQGKTTLDLSYLNSGVYFVKVNSTTYKLVIQK